LLPPALPPFPTRRLPISGNCSGSLVPQRISTAILSFRPSVHDLKLVVIEPIEDLALHGQALRARLDLESGRLHRLGRVGRRGKRDRKSTRLNSSHVKISY